MTVENYLIYIIVPIISLSLIVIVARFLKGPHIVDRVIALDLLINSGVGLIGIFCLVYEDSTFLDTAMILALIAFLSTIAFAYYLDRGNRKKTKKDE